MFKLFNHNKWFGEMRKTLEKNPGSRYEFLSGEFKYFSSRGGIKEWSATKRYLPDQLYDLRQKIQQNLVATLSLIATNKGCVGSNKIYTLNGRLGFISRERISNNKNKNPMLAFSPIKMHVSIKNFPANPPESLYSFICENSTTYGISFFKFIDSAPVQQQENQKNRMADSAQITIYFRENITLKQIAGFSRAYSACCHNNQLVGNVQHEITYQNDTIQIAKNDFLSLRMDAPLTYLEKSMNPLIYEYYFERGVNLFDLMLKEIVESGKFEEFKLYEIHDAILYGILFCQQLPSAEQLHDWLKNHKKELYSVLKKLAAEESALPKIKQGEMISAVLNLSNQEKEFVKLTQNAPKSEDVKSRKNNFIELFCTKNLDYQQDDFQQNWLFIINVIFPPDKKDPLIHERIFNFLKDLKIYVEEKRNIDLKILEDNLTALIAFISTRESLCGQQKITSKEVNQIKEQVQAIQTIAKSRKGEIQIIDLQEKQEVKVIDIMKPEKNPLASHTVTKTVWEGANAILTIVPEFMIFVAGLFSPSSVQKNTDDESEKNMMIDNTFRK